MCAPSFWPSKVGVVRDWKYIILVGWVRYYIPREVVKKAGNLRVTCNCDKTQSLLNDANVKKGDQTTGAFRARFVLCGSYVYGLVASSSSAAVIVCLCCLIAKSLASGVHLNPTGNGIVALVVYQAKPMFV